ncbi:MAG: aspartate kinase [Dokdonella sp.]
MAGRTARPRRAVLEHARCALPQQSRPGHALARLARLLRAEALPNQGEWARWLSASVEVRHDPAIAAALAARGEVFIAQGFIARNNEGATAVLGRGGSDTSAAYFGALLKAEVVEIWTDVPGMFSANPRQVPDARLLCRLDYAEAQEIATTGAKVLHPRCIHPVRDGRVPIRIKDTNRPHLPGTEIVWNTQAGAPSVKAISSRKGITLVSMESISMWQQVGFLADVFEAFKRHGLSVDLIGSAETNVTVSLDPSDNLLNSDVLARLCADLEAFCRVKVIAPCAAITLVGRGMRAMLHRLGRARRVRRARRASDFAVLEQLQPDLRHRRGAGRFAGSAPARLADPRRSHARRRHDFRAELERTCPCGRGDATAAWQPRTQGPARARRRRDSMLRLQPDQVREQACGPGRARHGRPLALRAEGQSACADPAHSSMPKASPSSA